MPKQCECGKSAKYPNCDGTHKTITKEQDLFETQVDFE